MKLIKMEQRLKIACTKHGNKHQKQDTTTGTGF